jgi:type IV secretion system protein VirB9
MKIAMMAVLIGACGAAYVGPGNAGERELPPKPSSPLISADAWAALVDYHPTADAAPAAKPASAAPAATAASVTVASAPAGRTSTVPDARPSDARIRVEQYDPNRVVKIFTAVGNPTLIQFEEDEQIVGTPKGMIGMGDAKAWSVGPKGSNIMLKPKAVRPDTKLLVVTTKRTYAFEIMSLAKNSKVEPTLIVRFDYPDTKAKMAQAEARKHGAVGERLAQIAGKDGGSGQRNRSFSKRGDDKLAPSQVEDDGRFTYMRFDSTKELPVVYKILPDGAEALTNYHMEPDTGTMVIHETAALFVLRYGKAVLAIRNDGFNPDGKLNLTGTTVPRTVRLQKDEP